MHVAPLRIAATLTAAQSVLPSPSILGIQANPPPFPHRMVAPTFVTKFGPWAVVTGASSGIGAGFARQLAAAGLNVVLTARREAALQALSAELEKESGVRTLVVPADIGTPAGWETVLSRTADIDVGLLINNAGVEVHGDFLRTELDKHLNLINVNVSSVTALAHGFGRRLVARGKGGIIVVSSVAAVLTAPHWQTYSASKKFVSNLAYVLGFELKPHGVSVLSLEPGVTDTPMILGDVSALGWRVASVDAVVRDGLKALEDGEMRITTDTPKNVEGDKAIQAEMQGYSDLFKVHWDSKNFLKSSGVSEQFE